MEQKKEAIICLQAKCHKLPIFSQDYQQEVHETHMHNTMEKTRIEQFIKSQILEGHNEKMMNCYAKLYQFDYVKDEIVYAIENLTDELDQKHIETYMPLYKKVFKPLQTLEYYEDYDVEEVLKIQDFLGLDVYKNGQPIPVVQRELRFQVVRQNKEFFHQIEETLEILKYKLIILKRKKLEVIDQLLRMNTRIGEVQIQDQEIDQRLLGKRKNQKKSSNEIKEIIATLQMYKNQQLKEAEEKDQKGGGQGGENGAAEGGEKGTNDMKQALENIDQSKLVFTGMNRFFIRRTEQEQINILCEAIQSTNMAEVQKQYLLSQNSIEVWKKQYLDQCLDILESKNIFFNRRPGWQRQGVTAKNDKATVQKQPNPPQ